jgi:DNA polymerase-1
VGLENRRPVRLNRILIFSGDHDLLQLVNDKTSVILTKKGMTELEEYNNDNFVEKMGFTPKQLIDYKGMIGDSSDNLPGIRGVGPKTAVKLIQEYQSLENVIANIDNLTGKLKELVQNDRDIALKTKYLATIKCDSQLDLDVMDTTYKGYDLNNLVRFYESVDFYSFIDRLDKQVTPEVKEDFFVHFNEVEKFSKEIIHEAWVSLELDEENYHKASVLGLGVYTDTNESYFFDSEHLKAEPVMAFLEAVNITKKVMDLKRLYVAFNYMGIKVQGFDFDLLLASYVINPSFASNSMTTLANNFMKTTLAFDETVIGKKGKTQTDMSLIANHALEKCRVLRKLEPKLLEKLEENNQRSLFKDIEIPLALILGNIELNGFKVDRSELVRIGTEFNRKVEELG